MFSGSRSCVYGYNCVCIDILCESHIACECVVFGVKNKVLGEEVKVKWVDKVREMLWMIILGHIH